MSTTSYSLSCTGGGGTVTGSATITVTTAGDTTAPSVPTNLKAKILAKRKVQLSWVASTDNVGVTGYRIFRDGSLRATVTGTSYRDARVVTKTTYRYTVAAFDAAGNVSALSSPVQITVP
jgi:fibronectin type 3 domain-containing protein